MLEATKTSSAPETSAVPANPALAAEAKIARIAVTIFPLLVVVAGVAGYLVPGASKHLGPSVPYLLGIIMFCMGLTLTPPDFASVAKRPGPSFSVLWRTTSSCPVPAGTSPSH